MENIYSSKQVAEIIGVNESTVKRWADSGALKCFRTPGGHRKFRKTDVSEFASKFAFTVPGKILKTFDRVFEPDFVNLKNTLHKKLLTGSDNDVYDYMNSQIDSGLTLLELYDNVAAPAMFDIGNQWANNQIGIETEHIASAKLTKAVIRLNSRYSKDEKNGMHALCAAPKDEHHELPLLLVSGILQNHGWNVIYSGVDMPHAAIIKSINSMKPDLVCLSTTVVKDMNEMKKMLSDIHLSASAAGSVIAIGGAAAKDMDNISLYTDFRAESLTELIKFTKEKFQV